MATVKDYTIEELTVTSGAERFSKLDSDRTAVLDRARECSKLTIPSIEPDDGHTESDDLDTPFQGLGAELVQGLVNKLILALFPPNSSFFRVMPDPKVVELTKEQGTNEELEKNLVIIEQGVRKQIEGQSIRVPIFEALKSLVVTGNSLLYKTEEGLKTYRLGNYVVLRDFRGNPLEIIARETLSKNSVPSDILEQLEDDEGDNTTVTIYTRAIKKEGVWYEFQEVNTVPLTDSLVKYTTPSELPFIPLRWTSINGESYGRGLVEQYLGDFRSLESLYQLLFEASSVMSKIIFGQRPGGLTDAEDINDAENGQCIYGDLENDITVLQVNKNMDLQVPLNMIEDITRRLQKAFLTASSAARDSERTTATEIRYLANDLEQSLGGVYSILSLELQKPLATIMLKKNSINIKDLGADLVVITGIEALGRNADLDKIRQFNGLVQELGSPDLVLQKINLDVYIEKIANALSLDITGLVKTAEQVQQEQSQAQQDALLAQGASNVVDGVTTPQ